MRARQFRDGLVGAAGFVSGVLLLLSYPPYDQSFLAWFALAPLIWRALFWEPRGVPRIHTAWPARWGGGHPGNSAWVMPLVFSGLGGLCWGGGLFYPLLFVEEGTPVERIGGFAIIGAITAGVLVLLDVISSRIAARPGPDRRWTAIPLVASAWVCVEYLVRAVAAGFSPYLGVTQWQVPALLAVSSYGGIYAVSWLIVAANTAIALLLPGPAKRDRGRRDFEWLLLAIGLATLWALVSGGHVGPLNRLDRPEAKAVATREGAPSPSLARRPLRVMLVQPQFTPAEYRAALGETQAQRRLWRQALDQTSQGLARLDGPGETLVVLPETVVHYPAWDDPAFRQSVSQMAREERIHWLIGLPRSHDPQDDLLGPPRGALGDGDDHKERNAALWVAQDGVGAFVYDKIYVIPVAESHFAPGRSPGVFEIQGHRMGVGICSDVVVPDHALATVRAGAESLHYIASLAHIGDIARLERAFVAFRAAEHGVVVTQTATTGPTLVVDGRGRLIAEAAGGEAAQLVVEIEPRAGGSTLYTRWGDWVVFAAGSILFYGCGLFRRPTRFGRGMRARGRGPRRDFSPPRGTLP